MDDVGETVFVSRSRRTTLFGSRMSERLENGTKLSFQSSFFFLSCNVVVLFLFSVPWYVIKVCGLGRFLCYAEQRGFEGKLERERK